MRTAYKILLLTIFFVATSFVAQARKSSQKEEFVIVIDAGHGGKDVGAKGSIHNEKDINLAVAKRLASLLKKKTKAKVMMTRSDDSFMSLNARTNFANNNNANLFISIHTNASQDRSPSGNGAETYVLGNANGYVAAYENSAASNDNSDKSNVANSKRPLHESVKFARCVQSEMHKTAKRTSRGVKCDNFQVLRDSHMPAVLIELGFITNPDDEQFLNSDDGQDLCAKAIFNAIKEKYGNRIGKKKWSNDEYTDDIYAEKDDKKESKSAKEPKDTKASDDKRPKKNADVANTDDVTYHVQILAVNKVLPKNAWDLHGLKNVNYFKEGRLYKYYYGAATTKKEIKKTLSDIKDKFPQAFIIKMCNGKKID